MGFKNNENERKWNTSDSIKHHICQLDMRNSTGSPIFSDFQLTAGQGNEDSGYEVGARTYDEKLCTMKSMKYERKFSGVREVLCK